MVAVGLFLVLPALLTWLDMASFLSTDMHIEVVFIGPDLPESAHGTSVSVLAAAQTALSPSGDTLSLHYYRGLYDQFCNEYVSMILPP